MKTLPLLVSLSIALAIRPTVAETALTIYNQNFAVVRDSVPLDLKAGLNEIRFSDMTATAETDSVILRDPSGKVKLRVLEQSYRNDPVSQELMLSLNEGKTLEFVAREPNKPDYTVQGKVVRSGYGAGGQAPTQPIIEVDGKLQFSLPGQPRFPALADDTVLNPTLAWKLDSNKEAKLDAELAYVTGGLSWKADYAAPVTGKYSPAELVSVYKTAVNGDPVAALASTSMIERANLTVRTHCKRLARLTLAFSKKKENFQAAIGLHLAYYNLVKFHGTLRCTPAMAAGVESSPWKVVDLVNATS